MKTLCVLCVLLCALCVSPLFAAVGDRDTTCTSPAAGAFHDTQTSGSVQRAITFILFEDVVEIQSWDGSTALIFEASLTGPGIYRVGDVGFAATATNRIRVKNLHGSLAKRICHIWVETK